MRKLKVKAFLFDFDGTLVDSMKAIYKVLNQTLKENRLPKIKPNLLGGWPTFNYNSKKGG